MKFKLTKLNLFLILLATLILSSLGIKALEGFNIIEGMTAEEEAEQVAKHETDHHSNSNESSGDQGGWRDDGDRNDTDPFNNAQNNSASDAFQRALQEVDYNDSEYGPDLNVTFQDSDANRSKLSFGAKNGITKDLIPPGEEHLYVLKSQMVPPVCPKCPKCEMPKNGGGGNCGCNKKNECPPCPRPQRCPEPAFTCKKVPNYSASNVDSILPSTMTEGGLNGTSAGAGSNVGGGNAMPVLNSFANFS